MAASDSEDFESADEGIEISSFKSVKNDSKSATNKENIIELPNSNENSTTDTLQNNPEVPTTENVNDEIPKRVIKVSNIGKKNTKEDKPKRHSVQRDSKTQNNSSTVKRLGSKLGTKVGAPVSENTDLKANNIKGSITDDDLTASGDKNIVNSGSSKDFSLNETDEKSSPKTSDCKNGSIDDNLLMKNNDSVLIKPEEDSFSNDGWDLEDGFDIPSDSKPKDNEEFEKELFPVLSKLSNLSTGSSTNMKNSDFNKDCQKGGSSGSNWSSWGNWGVGSLLSTATESVSTLTSHVSAGLNTVLETGLGAPDPEALAQALEKERLEKEAVKETCKDGEEGSENLDATAGIGIPGIGGGFSSLMSGVSQLSTKVITGGLDTLESLGKKTMEVLQDGDPGLRKKRALFFQDDDKPVLSQILREAKEVAEKSDKLEEDKQAARRVHFETLFDDYHGLVHLEALEMLSKQCQLKIHTILLGTTGDALKDLRETIDQVKELCELSDEEDEENDKDDDNSSDFSKKVTDAINLMGVQVPSSKLIEVSENVTKWLASDSAKNSTPLEVHQKAVSSMAEFTSVSMETFHRMAELLLIKQHHSTADEAESLTQLTGILCARVSRMATKFTLLLSENDESNSNNGIITTVFMESANSSSYIQDACRLIVPVLQIGAST